MISDSNWSSLPTALVCDLDDTLIDDSRNRSQALTSALQRYSLPVTSNLLREFELFSRRDWGGMPCGSFTSDEVAHGMRVRAMRHVLECIETGLGADAELANSLGCEYAGARAVLDYSPCLGGLELIEWAHEMRIQVVVATNGLSRLQRAKVHGLPYASLPFVTPDLCGHRKPCLWFLNAVEEECSLGRNPWFIGDNWKTDLEWVAGRHVAVHIVPGVSFKRLPWGLRAPSLLEVLSELRCLPGL